MAENNNKKGVKGWATDMLVGAVSSLISMIFLSSIAWSFGLGQLYYEHEENVRMRTKEIPLVVEQIQEVNEISRQALDISLANKTELEYRRTQTETFNVLVSKIDEAAKTIAAVAIEVRAVQVEQAQQQAELNNLIRQARQ